MSCPDSPVMRDKLMSAVNHGTPDREILVDFQNEYGPTALAAPRFTRFNHVAWIMPPLVLLLGLGIVALTVRRWRLQPASMPASPRGYSKTEYDQVRDRIRHDTEL
jgi:cytochrome c-type biogenesis protein CcmH/NrfF